MTDTTTAALVAQLTDAEKVSLTAGSDAWNTVPVGRLGIAALRLGDGPHGVRRPHDGSGMSMFDSHPATCFPTAAALGASWDPRLVHDVGVALGREAAAHGIDVLLGPGVNLKRTPVGGRNFEYFSEDPLVSAQLGAAWVNGVQSTGVGASLKHFAANNTESRRYGIDAVVDERALRELYLASFESVVRQARPATVMAAYNRLNGSHCTESDWLLNGVLRSEWGFEGVVVSDWGAAWDRTVSIAAGCDLAMPGLGRGDDGYVLEGVRSGALPEKALDASVGRVLELARRYGRGDGRQRGGAGTDAVIGAGIDAGTRGVTGSDLAAHHLLARRAAAAGTVLLRNEGGVLPLRRGVRVAVIGEFARRPRFQGAGSSHVVPTRVDTLFGALTEALGASWVTFAPGYDTESDESAAAQLAEAVRVAESADVAIVVVGLPEVYETEGVDRDHLRLPAAHDRLVEAVRAVNPGTVVVLQNGSPVELPWRGDVAAIVEGYLGGQAGGSALADVLIGVAEPGGRLAETFPVRYADHAVSSLPNGPAAVEYRESLYVGYRWFDSADERVAFPFGHGLSYASFEWSDVTTSTSGPEAGDRVTIELTVTNTSDRRGSEVVQVYVHDVESSMFRPEQELKGFAKVELDAGASERVSIELDRRAFSFWQTSGRRWTLEPGDFEIRVGRSSRDILWRTLVGLGEPAETAGAAEAPLSAGPSPAAQPAAYRAPSRKSGFTVADFEALLGRPVPANVAAPPGEFTLDTALTDMQLTWVGRLLFAISRRQALKALGAPSTDRVHAAAGDVVAQVTFRMFPTVTEGVVGRRRTLQLLRLVNRLSRRR